MTFTCSPSAIPSVSMASGLAIGSGLALLAISRARGADLGARAVADRGHARREGLGLRTGREHRARVGHLPHRPEHVVEREVGDAGLRAKEIGMLQLRLDHRQQAAHVGLAFGQRAAAHRAPWRIAARSLPNVARNSGAASDRQSLIMPPPGWKPIGTVMLNITLSAK
jgi:hypothetical protein